MHARHARAHFIFGLTVPGGSVFDTCPVVLRRSEADRTKPPAIMFSYSTSNVGHWPPRPTVSPFHVALLGPQLL
jgi:hypothetical protein